MSNRPETIRCQCCGDVLFSYNPATGEIIVRCHKGSDTAITMRSTLSVAPKNHRVSATSPSPVNAPRVAGATVTNGPPKR